MCEAYPNLFAIAANKNALVKEAWSLDEGRGCWNPLFSRSFNDRELEEVTNFLLCLSKGKVQTGVEDKVLWNEMKNGLFSAKSLFKVLDSVLHGYFPC